MEYVVPSLALLLGAAIGWIAARRRTTRVEAALNAELAGSKECVARLEVRIAERERDIDEQRASLASAREVEAALVPELASSKESLARFEERLAERERAIEEQKTFLESTRRTEATLVSELASSKEALARFEVRVAERERVIEEQKTFLESTRQQIQDAFARLSQEALVKNSQSILEQTSERLAPLREALSKLEAKTQEIEKGRAQAYGSLEKHLGDLAQATQHLRTSNEVLVTAFKGSMTARGRFGELQLRNLVELAGMLQHCDFSEQEALEGGARPDMIIRLPENGGLPVDAKMPLSAYWTACETNDAEARKAALQEHAQALRRHVRELGRRDYSQHLAGRFDYAVLFVPSEPILSAAFEAAPEVFEEALRLGVLIVTPVTLFALLRTTRIVWDQRKLGEHAHEIQEEATELYRRVVTYHQYVADIGSSLTRTTKAFNSAVASFETRVLPAGRRLEELGAADTRKKLEDLAEVEIVPRTAARGVPAPSEQSEAENPSERVNAIERPDDAAHGALLLSDIEKAPKP